MKSDDDIVREGAPGAALTRRGVLEAGARMAIGVPLGLSALAHATGAAAEAKAPRTGGTLVQVISADPASANPSITTAIPDLALGCLIYEGLTRIEQDFTPAPSLARSWSVSPDGLRYTFSLVEAKWQDGKPFTSADVKHSLEEVSAKFSPKFRAAGQLITGIETPDARTVVIALSEPYGPLLFSLSAYGGGAILPEHLLKGTNVLQNPATLDKPVGTGPFMLTEWSRGDRLVLVRNPNYWRPNRPYLDQIVLKIVPDGGTRVIALKAGEVDYAYYYFFPTSRIREIENDPRLQLREQAVPQDKLIIWNTKKPPFDRVEVRQALLRATDREYIKKVVYHGLGNVQRNHMDSRLSWAHDPKVDLAQIYPYDVEAAKKMLDDAGLKPDSSGRRFDVRLAFASTDTDFGRLAQVLGAMWGKIGVRVVYEGTPFNVNIEQVFINSDFDATLQPYTTAGDPALGVARLYITSAIQKRPFLNASGYSNPDVDRLFELGARHSSPEERGVHYKQLAPILARDLPVFPLWETVAINVASRRVQGKWAWSTGYSHWEEVWLDS